MNINTAVAELIELIENGERVAAAEMTSDIRDLMHETGFAPKLTFDQIDYLLDVFGEYLRK